MTLSISEMPSHWHRVTGYPKLLMSDATIDPFPYNKPGGSSLLDHHIVKNHPHDTVGPLERGRRSTVPVLRSNVEEYEPIHDINHNQESLHTEHPLEGSNRKRSAAAMAGQGHSRSSSPASAGQAEGGNQFCLCQPEPKIPRPRNAFILYRQHQQAAVAHQHPGLPNPAISKIIGEQWSRLPEDAKSEWKALAEEEKARHAQQYPDYRYQPRRSGRYSSQSSTAAAFPGGKPDQQGNCMKCGGKTMNPPTTQYAGYPLTPQRPSASGPRHAQQATVSPPQTGVRSHGGWLPPPPGRYETQHDPRHDPRYDPRHDPRNEPRSRYDDGPDLKRRRFDGSGIYIPTREWRELPPYQYSPRAAYYRGEMPPEAAHRPSLANASRPMYGPQSNAPQLPPPPATRPVYQQHQGRAPSLTLPPIKTPVSKPVQTQLSAVERIQGSGIEAMIMSIQVLNKLKTLGTISPPLATPSPASPQPEVRGAIVAVEGMDATTVNSMTNSLAEELERDGKFVVRIFGGPDPYSICDDASTRRPSKTLSHSDCLEIIGEWHKISQEMKRYITTRPGIEDDADTPMACTQNKTVEIPDRNDASWASKDRQSVAEEDTSPNLVSPKTMMKTRDLSLTSPPGSAEAREGLKRFSFQKNEEEPPYTRIPAGAMLAATHARQLRPKTSPSTTKPLDTVPLPKDQQGDKDINLEEQAKPPTSTPPRTSNASTNDATISTCPSISSTASSFKAGPIPIALVPHYQLTTVDTTSIAMPITDSYSPLAHWQWLATLWRGCVGADVTVVIRNAGVSEGDESPNAGKLNSGSDAAAPTTKPYAAVQGQDRDGRSMSVATTSTGTQGSISSLNKGQGVEVRLMDCRAVVVRLAEKKAIIGGDENREREWETEREEFWEKAKRRVGFEVGEFLRK